MLRLETVEKKINALKYPKERGIKTFETFNTCANIENLGNLQKPCKEKNICLKPVKHGNLKWKS